MSVAGAIRTGRAIDLRGFDVAPATVAEAVRGEPVHGETGDDCAVECPDPGPVHDHVGPIRAEIAFSLRPALAAAARSRGHTAPQADELAAVRDRLAALDVPETDLRRARRRVADVSDAEADLRERVASLRGRVQALRGTREEASEAAERDLAEATRRLSEVETDRIAAEQALARARERATANREVRRERLRLQDRADNLRRAARESLAGDVRAAFADARGAIPGGTDLGDSVATALAVARVAEMDAPVVLSREVSPFEGVADAARWLDGPVLGV